MSLPSAARDRILEVSLALFVERGYEAVGVQEIVDRSGVTKPTLYHHFGNKRGLLDELCVGLTQMVQSVLRATEVDGDLSVRLTALTGALFRLAEAHPHHFRLLLLLYNAPTGSAVRAAGTAVQTLVRLRLESLFRSAARQHGNMTGRERAYTVSLLGTLFAYGLLLIDGELEPSETLPYRVMHQFSHGVYS